MSTVVYFILFMIVVPEVLLFIILAFSSEEAVSSPASKTNIGWLDDFTIYINKFFVDLSTQEKILWVLISVIIYVILLVLVRYKDVYILFILSNVFVIYFIYNVAESMFKLIVAWNIIITILISLSAIGFRWKAFEIVRVIIEDIIEVVSDVIFKIKISDIKHSDNAEVNDEDTISKQQEQYKKYEQYDDNFNYDYVKYAKEKAKSEDKTYKTPYEILGVSKEDDIETIKKVYKSLSKTYHPDMNDSSLASDKFMEINEAWKKISEERNFK